MVRKMAIVAAPKRLLGKGDIRLPPTIRYENLCVPSKGRDVDFDDQEGREGIEQTDLQKSINLAVAQMTRYLRPRCRGTQLGISDGSSKK